MACTAISAEMFPHSVAAVALKEVPSLHNAAFHFLPDGPLLQVHGGDRFRVKRSWLDKNEDGFISSSDHDCRISARDAVSGYFGRGS